MARFVALRQNLRLRPKRLAEAVCFVIGHANSGICERCGRRSG
jgi:hypothetical protein